MNQDQIKKLLLKLEDDVDNFEVVFSGKVSKKVNGLYKPDLKEIIIHNKNFEDDNALIYTAIHEFAHHIQFTRSLVPISGRAHTTKFYDILHRLLFKAEKKGIYNNIFETKEFTEITQQIKDKFLSTNSNLMKEFGSLLMHAYILCNKYNASFDDYMDRSLGFSRSAGKAIVKIHDMDVNPSISFESMKVVASIKDDIRRGEAQQAFVMGDTADMVKAKFRSKPAPEDLLTYLVMERDKLERALEKVTLKLAALDQRIEDLKK